MASTTKTKPARKSAKKAAAPAPEIKAPAPEPPKSKGNRPLKREPNPPARPTLVIPGVDDEELQVQTKADEDPGIPRFTEEEMEQFDVIADRFKAMTDRTRIGLMVAIDRGEGQMNVGQLSNAVGMSQPAVSHHITIMRHAGLLISNRRSKCNFYRLTPLGSKMVGIIKKAV